MYNKLSFIMTSSGVYSNSYWEFLTNSVTSSKCENTADGIVTWSSGANNVLMKGVLDPVDSNDAATKSYVDASATTMSWKTTVHAASTANIASLSGLFTLDGIALSVGDRVLIKDQTTKSLNGIYTASSGTWSRSYDATTSTMAAGSAVWVHQGTVNKNRGYVVHCTGCTTFGSIIEWAVFSETPTSSGVLTDIQIKGVDGTFDNAVLSTFKFIDSATIPAITVGKENSVFSINGITATTLTAAGTGISLNAGTGESTGDGGIMDIVAGAGGGTTGSGGKLNLFSGTGGDTTGVGGELNLKSGNGGSTGTGGLLNITSGSGGTTSGNGGAIAMSTGQTTIGPTGAINLTTGVAAIGATGLISLKTGNAGGTTAESGDIELITGIGAGSGSGGDITLTSGNSSTTGAGGNINFTTGTGGSTSGSGGDFNITLGSATAGSDKGKMVVTGNVNASSQGTGSFQVVGGASITGNVYGLTFVSTSDANQKKEITRLKNSLNTIMKVNGYEYIWKDDSRNNGKKEMGVLAQQLEEIGLGDIVTGDDVVGKAVSYNHLIPLIIEAIKELVLEIRS
jgi:hypothetical protein